MHVAMRAFMYFCRKSPPDRSECAINHTLQDTYRIAQRSTGSSWWLYEYVFIFAPPFASFDVVCRKLSAMCLCFMLLEYASLRSCVGVRFVYVEQSCDKGWACLNWPFAEIFRGKTSKRQVERNVNICGRIQLYCIFALFWSIYGLFLDNSCVYLFVSANPIPTLYLYSTRNIY